MSVSERLKKRANITNVIVFSFKMSSNNVCAITTCECGKVYTRNVQLICTGEKRVLQPPTQAAIHEIEETIETYLAEKFSIGIDSFEVDLSPYE